MNEFFCLEIFEYLNIFEYLQSENYKNSINEYMNIFVALNVTKYFYKWIYLSRYILIYNIFVYLSHTALVWSERHRGGRRTNEQTKIIGYNIGLFVMWDKTLVTANIEIDWFPYRE